MNKKYLKTIGIVSALVFALPALGQERQGLMQDIRNEREDFRQDVMEQRKETREEVQTNRQEVRNEIKDIRASGTGTSTREEIKNKFREMREINIALRASTTADIKARREAMQTDIKKRILEFKEGRKVRLDEVRKNSVKKHLANAFEKLENSIERLREFNEKISARIEAKSDAGVDVTSAEEALLAAQISLEEASVAVEATNIGATNAVDESIEITKESLQSSVETAIEAIKKARAKYAEVLKALGISIATNASTETN